MEKEIAAFYEARDLGLPKLIARCPKKIKGVRIEQAAKQVYNEIRAGLEIKPIAIAWRVWSVAEDIDATEYIEYNRSIEDIREIHEATMVKTQLNHRLFTELTAMVMLWAYWGIEWMR